MVSLTASVIIPTYNSAPLVAGAVESVLAQTRPAAEVVVVDDGSADDTAERLARYGDRVRYVRKANGGVSSARNRGVAGASGDVIGFLDADDVWHPRKLELQLAALAAHPDVGLLATGIYDWPADAHPPVDPAGPDRPVSVSFDRLLAGNMLCTSTVVVRAEVIRAAGEFDSSLQGPEDYDLWLRVARRNRIAVLPDRLTGYRVATPNSLSKNAVRMEDGLLAILGKLEADGAFAGRPLLRRKAWAYVRHTCGFMYRDAGQYAVAADKFARSLVGWPFRLHRDPGGRSAERLRVFAATIRGLVSERKRATNAAVPRP